MSPTHQLVLDLCARLRLACESISELAGADVVPADIRLDDLDPEVRNVLQERAASDLWEIINASNQNADVATRRSA